MCHHCCCGFVNSIVAASAALNLSSSIQCRSHSGPLSNKRILITTPNPGLFSSLSSAFITHNARPLWTPSVHIHPLSPSSESFTDLQFSLMQLVQHFHLLTFNIPSMHSIRESSLAITQGDLRLMKHAFQSASVPFLTFHKYTQLIRELLDLELISVPLDATPRAICDALELGDASDEKSVLFVVPRRTLVEKTCGREVVECCWENVVKAVIEESLEKNVEMVYGCEVVESGESEWRVEAELLKNGKVDAILMMSADEVVAVNEIVPLKSLSENVAVFVNGYAAEVALIACGRRADLCCAKWSGNSNERPKEKINRELLTQRELYREESFASSLTVQSIFDWYFRKNPRLIL